MTGRCEKKKRERAAVHNLILGSFGNTQTAIGDNKNLGPLTRCPLFFSLFLFLLYFFSFFPFSLSFFFFFFFFFWFSLSAHWFLQNGWFQLLTCQFHGCQQIIDCTLVLASWMDFIVCTLVLAKWMVSIADVPISWLSTNY